MTVKNTDREREDLIIALKMKNSLTRLMQSIPWHSATETISQRRQWLPMEKKETMMMATCKVRNTAEYNLNGLGVPQHEESHVKMLTQTTAVIQNGT